MSGTVICMWDGTGNVNQTGVINVNQSRVRRAAVSERRAGNQRDVPAPPVRPSFNSIGEARNLFVVKPVLCRGKSFIKLVLCNLLSV